MSLAYNFPQPLSILRAVLAQALVASEGSICHSVRCRCLLLSLWVQVPAALLIPAFSNAQPGRQQVVAQQVVLAPLWETHLERWAPSFSLALTVAGI